MTPDEKFLRIVREGLCIGCGLCQSVCGKDKILLAKNKDGELRPSVVGALAREDVDKVYATCPGTRVEGLPEGIRQSAPHSDVIWGAYHRLVLGWAGDAGVRYEGSTGGVLTALGQYLLHTRRVAFILHVRASETDPTFGAMTLSRKPDEVLKAAGSRYGPTDVLSQLDDVLDRREPFALIAKPCDLNALRNLAHHDARVNRYIKYWLTPVCGGYMPTKAMDAFLSTRHLSRDTITSLRYRGRGCPGPTTIEACAGAFQDIDYLDLWGEDESSWSLPFRCKICPDGIGEGADIAAADNWPGGSPDRELAKTDPGTNAMIIRTKAGLELVEAARRDGALVLGNDIAIDHLSTTQPHQVNKKMYVGARYAGLAKAGRLAPETIAMRLSECAALADGTELERQKTGAYERAMQLKEESEIDDVGG